MSSRALSVVPDPEQEVSIVAAVVEEVHDLPASPIEGELPVASSPLESGSSTAPAFWCVGAHGGAGATTLAQLWAPAGDAGQVWPAAEEFTTCVVVCRSTMTGLDAAHSVVLQGQRDDRTGCTVLGVVVIADSPGKLSKPLKQKISVLAELSTLWHIGYEHGIRDHLPHELATWIPSPEAESPKKRRKKQGVTEEVPVEVARVGHEVFLAAYQAVKATDSKEED